MKQFKLSQEMANELKSKLRGYRADVPAYTYGQWVGVEIECFLNKDEVEAKFLTDGECHGDHECDCDLDDARADWVNTRYTAHAVLHMSDRERSRLEYQAFDAIYCEENHCDCELGENLDHHAIKRHFKNMGLPNITCESDGSLSSDDGDLLPIEFQVNFEIGNPEPLRVLCDFIADCGGTVNKTCGLHVHFDRRENKVLTDAGMTFARTSRKDNELMASIFTTYLDLFKSIVPESRRSNTYCQVRAASTKYSYVNLSYDNTIEFRFFNGSTDFAKILKFCNFLNETMKQVDKGVTCKNAKYTPETQAFIAERHALHSPELTQASFNLTTAQVA